jgi:hypothetical protein
MHSSNYLTLDGDVRQMRQADIDALSGRISGGLLGRGDKNYDDARKVWNATVDHRPTLIARCMSDADVQAAVRFAAAERMRLSVRGGGHHIAGNAVVEGRPDDRPLGLAHGRRRRREADRAVAPGALLSDFDREAQAHRLATPLGINSTTGVAGLTLGGGFGWLTRSLGLTIDNLLGVTIVTADGTLHQVSATSEPSCSGPCAAAAATSASSPRSSSASIRSAPKSGPGSWSIPARRPARCCAPGATSSATAPEALSVWAVLRKAPPLALHPAEHHGRDVVIFPLVCVGDMAAARRPRRRWRPSARRSAQRSGRRPMPASSRPSIRCSRRAVATTGSRTTSATLSDAAIDLMIEAAKTGPGPECEIFVAQLGGAMARVDPAATAFVGRDAAYIMNVHGRWGDASDDKRVREWARKVFTDSAPHATGGGYVNFLTEDEGERVAATYGANYARLQAVKQRYDPGNLFRANLNIAPQAGT